MLLSRWIAFAGLCFGALATPLQAQNPPSLLPTTAYSFSDIVRGEGEELWGRLDAGDEAAAAFRQPLALSELFSRLPEGASWRCKDGELTSLFEGYRDVLLSLDEKGLRAYHAANDGMAAMYLDEARKATSDHGAVAEVAVRFPLTPASHEALGEFIAFHVDMHRFAVAALIGERLLSEVGVSSLSTPVLEALVVANAAAARGEQARLFSSQLAERGVSADRRDALFSVGRSKPSSLEKEVLALWMSPRPDHRVELWRLARFGLVSQLPRYTDFRGITKEAGTCRLLDLDGVLNAGNEGEWQHAVLVLTALHGPAVLPKLAAAAPVQKRSPVRQLMGVFAQSPQYPRPLRRAVMELLFDRRDPASIVPVYDYFGPYVGRSGVFVDDWNHPADDMSRDELAFLFVHGDEGSLHLFDLARRPGPYRTAALHVLRERRSSSLTLFDQAMELFENGDERTKAAAGSYLAANARQVILVHYPKPLSHSVAKVMLSEQLEVRREMAAAFRSRPPRPTVIEFLRTTAQGDEPRLREYALGALTMVDPEGSRALLLEAIQDESAEIREAVYGTLLSMASSSSLASRVPSADAQALVKDIIENFRDPRFAHPEEVIPLIARLGIRARAAEGRLYELYAAPGSSTHLRAQVLMALYEIQGNAPRRHRLTIDALDLATDADPENLVAQQAMVELEFEFAALSADEQDEVTAKVHAHFLRARLWKPGFRVLAMSRMPEAKGLEIARMVFDAGRDTELRQSAAALALRWKTLPPAQEVLDLLQALTQRTAEEAIAIRENHLLQGLRGCLVRMVSSTPPSELDVPRAKRVLESIGAEKGDFEFVRTLARDALEKLR